MRLNVLVFGLSGNVVFSGITSLRVDRDGYFSIRITRLLVDCGDFFGVCIIRLRFNGGTCLQPRGLKSFLDAISDNEVTIR